MKKLICLLLTFVCCTAMLSACGDSKTPAAQNNLIYRVAVTDSAGTPVTEGVVVKFLQDGQQAAMQAVNAQGVAEKTLPTGNYTAEIVFTDVNASYFYDASLLTLTPDKTEVTVALFQKISGEPVTLYVSGEDVNAYNVKAGSTAVELKAGRNYFLFTPTQSGDYGIYTQNNTNAVGLYGAPHFVQSESVAEAVDGVVKTTVKDSMIGSSNTGTAIYVIGVDAQEDCECVLVIERLGDPTWDPSDAPWTVYETTAPLAPYTLPEGAQLVNFDLTATKDAYDLVYNEADGRYHLNRADGPLVLMYLTEPTTYLDSFEIICSKSRIGKYFYKEDGSFDRKESYNECLLEYMEYADESTGVYPLTSDLIYIIQNRGGYCGWFDPQAGGAYLFYDANGNMELNINKDIAWMFALCYIA